MLKTSIMKKSIFTFSALLILSIAISNNSAIAQWILNNVYPLGDSLQSIMFVNSNTGWIVGYSGTILKSTNGGANWNAQNSNTDSDIHSIFFIDASTGWAAGSVGAICRTTNGGANWFSEAPGGFWFSIFFANANTGWAAGIMGAVIKTTDGGLNWFPQQSGTSVMLLTSICFINVNTGWISGIDGVICKTTNGGNNWNAQNNGSISYYFIKFINENTGWVNGNGIIYKSTNGGLNWESLNNNPVALSLCFLNSQTGYATSAPEIILKTTNGGISWISQMSGTSSLLNSIFFTDIYHGWACGWGGVIARTTNGGSTFITNTGTNIPDNYSLSQNYPNPFNPSTIINFQLPTNNFVSLIIYDITGKVIETLVNEQLSAGSYKVDWNASRYPSGIYFCRIETGNFSKTIKMSLIK
jgi:photosystem II stability/assembly factor-like uncharacterized protein